MITLFGMIAGCLYLAISGVYVYKHELWLAGAWFGWGGANICYAMHEWFK
jgi:hypothetical protein